MAKEDSHLLQLNFQIMDMQFVCMEKQKDSRQEMASDINMGIRTNSDADCAISIVGELFEKVRDRS